mmetsp:Transcript_56760/g.172808  ORF Transcript_56760/g.172808 Transcript_56760/m.172808 type:complete len:278 (-) Transcript_56760:119-952(-)
MLSRPKKVVQSLESKAADFLSTFLHTLSVDTLMAVSSTAFTIGSNTEVMLPTTSMFSATANNTHTWLSRLLRPIVKLPSAHARTMASLRGASGSVGGFGGGGSAPTKLFSRTASPEAIATNTLSADRTTTPSRNSMFLATTCIPVSTGRLRTPLGLQGPGPGLYKLYSPSKVFAAANINSASPLPMTSPFGHMRRRFPNVPVMSNWTSLPSKEMRLHVFGCPSSTSPKAGPATIRVPLMTLTLVARTSTLSDSSVHRVIMTVCASMMILFGAFISQW